MLEIKSFRQKISSDVEIQNWNYVDEDPSNLFDDTHNLYIFFIFILILLWI